MEWILQDLCELVFSPRDLSRYEALFPSVHTGLHLVLLRSGPLLVTRPHKTQAEAIPERRRYLGMKSRRITLPCQSQSFLSLDFPFIFIYLFFMLFLYFSLTLSGW